MLLAAEITPRMIRIQARNVAARANTALSDLARIAFDGDVDEIETKCLEPLENRIQRRLVRELA